MAEPFVPEICRVALLAGGTSAEREISIASGDGAEAALRESGFPVTRFDPASEADMEALAAGAAAGEFDVAFLCLHGKGGEDGTIQAKLEEMGLRYTGSGVDASQIAIDKNCAKCAYKRDHLPTPPWVYLEARTVEHARERGVLDMVLGKATELLGERTVVKAVNQGSTQGLFISDSPDDLGRCIDEALEFDSSVIVERYIAGDEFTVAVLGNAIPTALPVIEIVPKSGFYDFEAKYAPGGSKHLCPAPISDELTDRIQKLAIAAHQSIGCRGMSRTDFIVDANGKPWILETNTIPGMTKTSLLPDAARVAGMDFPALCTRIVQLALE